MTTQAFTFMEMDAIRGALLDDIARTDLPIDTKAMKEALKKVDRAIDDTWHRQSKNLYFLIVPVAIEEITEEQ